jgi:cephalosporin hydroxylase
LRSIADQFHRQYYESGIWRNTFWLGVAARKCPLDLWIYQEILFETRPEVIIESGTESGGSALFLASVCDLIGEGKVITIDLQDNPLRPKHPRITYVSGSSVAPETVDLVKKEIESKTRVMIILDSDHGKDHVLKELRAYADLVSPGSYLIVEDTNVNNHPVAEDFGSGPMEAVEEFLTTRDDFNIDREREKFFLTFNPKGYLRRVDVARASRP